MRQNPAGPPAQGQDPVLERDRPVRAQESGAPTDLFYTELAALAHIQTLEDNSGITLIWGLEVRAGVILVCRVGPFV